jgi:hypothetical protein
VRYYYNHFLKQSLPVLLDDASVSIFAVNYALYLGCSPIILIGQDLCRYGERFYADEKGVSEVKASGLPRNMLDINGESVVTEDALLAIRHGLEIRNRDLRDHVKIINATEAGLGIPGMENQRFADCIERYIAPNNCNVADVIQSVTGSLCKEKPSQEITRFYQHLLDQIEQIAVLNGKKLSLLKKLNKLKERGLKAGRLAEQVKQVGEINGELEKNDFYREVLWVGISGIADISRMGLTCLAGGDQQAPEVSLHLETYVYDLTERCAQEIRKMVEAEMSGQEEQVGS